MRKWKKQVSLSQLSLTDGATLADCVFYRLAVGSEAPPVRSVVSRSAPPDAAGELAESASLDGLTDTLAPFPPLPPDGRRSGSDSEGSAAPSAAAGGDLGLSVTRLRAFTDPDVVVAAMTPPRPLPAVDKRAVVTEWSAPRRSLSVAVRGSGSSEEGDGWPANGSLLRPFQHVVLVGSQQDGYTPHHSCRAETCPAHAKVCPPSLCSPVDPRVSPRGPVRVPTTRRTRPPSQTRTGGCWTASGEA